MYSYPVKKPNGEVIYTEHKNLESCEEWVIKNVLVNEGDTALIQMPSKSRVDSITKDSSSYHWYHAGYKFNTGGALFA